MKISCNRLKNYIKDSDSIDWLKIWDLFTIRTAEVENVTIKGNDMKDVVVAQITECKDHPTKPKYHLLKVTDGENDYNILCGAPNVRTGLKAPLVKIGGMVSNITIAAKCIAGFTSEGMLCSGTELGINDYSEGIIELPDDAPLGVDLKEYLPIDDIIVEIDNKSLTNRPDLWGHYGIAREIAAITNRKLLPLDVVEVENNLNDLNIEIVNPDLCKRYCSIKLDNILNNNTPLDLQIFLHYIDIKTISLIVDLTNILMVELGQPMHAFDSRKVDKIKVELAKENDTFTTLDGVTRKLTKDTLMIKNNDEYIGVAGIIGGLDSEIVSDTTSIVLESANFDATSIRKSAINLGRRTEASARYEKSLDPNIADIAIKRFIYLLKEYNPELIVASNLTDKKGYEDQELVVPLTKKMLKIYIDEDISNERIIQILESLEFKVKEENDRFLVTVPSFRATKDISLEADLIEEIARIYGYENIEPKPLKINVTFKEHEFDYTNMYDIKKFLATRYSLHEIHSYLWYDSSFLKQNCIEKENVTIINKNDNNILRDDLSLSLMPLVKFNLTNFKDVNIFEIGTIIKNNQNKQMLSIILASDYDNLENNYNLGKKIITELFKNFKNKDILFAGYETEKYYRQDFALQIIADNKMLGSINVSNTMIGKKKSAVCIDIDIDEFLNLPKEELIVKKISKFPIVDLDYTIIAPLETNYKMINDIVKEFTNKYIISYRLKDIYNDGINKKYTISYTIGSNEKTLEQSELNAFKNMFINYIKSNNLEIIE